MNKTKSSPFLIFLSFAIIYIVWGSTYLANEYAIDFLPPWMMASSRFIISGGILLLYARMTNWEKVNTQQWLHALLLGLLFMSIGIGGTVWAQKFVDSGIASLVVSMNPLVVVLWVWILFKQRPTWQSSFGVMLGLIGMYLLVNQNTILLGDQTIIGILTILFCVVCWTFGSVILSKLNLPKSQMQSAGMQMLTGGLVLLPISLWTGEYQDFHIQTIPWSSWIALAYLIIFGSIAAFTAFNYLLVNVSPEKVSTSAYVNPVIAVFLGWWFRNEILTPQTLLAAGFMLAGVYFINKFKSKT